MAAGDRRTAYVSLGGTPKYATRRLPARTSAANGEPRPASCRAYLSSALPAIYQDGDFGIRFVGALQTLLDPIVAVLDSLPAHFDPDLAPEDVLELLAGWLGVELDESWPVERRHELVRRAGDLARRRGTMRGLELVLSIAFPELALRVEDGGGVTWATDPEVPAPDRRPEFVVHCDVPLEGPERAAVARTIEQAKPAHVSYRLRVRRSEETAIDVNP